MSSCCSCQGTPGPSCKTMILDSELAELLYVQGLDVNLCKKWAPIANLLQLRDCAGNVIVANAQVVLCSEFQTRLCTILGTLASGGAVTLGVTEVVGANCQTYVIPETPLIANDSTTIDFTTGGAFGHTLTAVVRVSADLGNIIEVRGDGLYVPDTETLCEQLEDLPTAAPIVLGVTPVLADDCTLRVVPETVITPADTVSVNMSAGGAFGHTISAEVNISDIVGNQLIEQVDGLYVPATAPTVLAVADSNCIDMSISGPPGAQIISASPIISPDAGNDLECRVNGLFVDVCAELAATTPVGSATPGVTQLVGRDCNSYTLPVVPGETPISVVDTSCIDLSVGGPNNHTIQANLVISAAPGNAAQCTPFGLYVSDTDSNIDINVTDTPCINMSVNEAPVGTFNLSAQPVISPAIDNILECTAQGLYVPAAAGGNIIINGVDTDCASTQVNEAPAGTFAIQVEPVISPALGNILECTALGLFVPASVGTEPSITGDSTNCIDVNVSNPSDNTFIVTANPNLANTYPGYDPGCNSLLCSATGLATPPDVAQDAVFPEATVVAIFNEAMSNLETFVSAISSFNVDNPSTCRSAVAHIGLRIPEVSVQQASGAGRSKVNILVEHDVNLPGVLVTGGFVFKTNFTVDIDAPAAGTREWMTPAFDLMPVYVLPPGFAGGVIQWRITVTQEIGTSTNVLVNSLVPRGSIIATGN